MNEQEWKKQTRLLHVDCLSFVIFTKLSFVRLQVIRLQIEVTRGVRDVADAIFGRSRRDLFL